MGGSAAKQPTTTNETKTVLSPQQEQLFNLAMPFAEQHAATAMPSFNTPAVAGFTPEQLAAQERYKTQGAVGDNIASQTAATHSFLLNPAQLDPTSNPHISAIADQITGKIRDGLVETTLPNIRTGSIQAGGMYGGGSTRGQVAEGRAIGDAASATGDALSKLYFDNYNAGINNMFKAAQLTPSIQAQQLFGANILDAVGGQKQAMEQALLNDQLQRQMLDQYAPYFRAQEIAALLGAMPNTASTVSTNTGVLPKANPITSGLGGAASGAAIGSIVPGIGTALGAVLGGLAGAGSSFL